MKRLFLLFLNLLDKFTTITEANLYKSEKWATIECEKEDIIYKISIEKKEKEKENA